MSDLLAAFDNAASAAAPSASGGLLSAFDRAAASTPKQPAAAPKSASWVEALPDHPARPLSENNAGAGAVIQALTGGGAAIIGGWHGIATAIADLASGENLETTLHDAAKSVEEEQAARTISPAPGSDADVIGRSSMNPVNWPAAVGNAAGNKVNDITGSPALATAVDAGLQVFGPAAAVKLARVPLRTVLKPESVPPRVEPTLAAPSPPPLTVDPSAPINLTLVPSEPVPPRPEPMPGAVPAAASPPVPAAVTPQAPRFSDPTNGVFAESAPDVKGGLPPSEQLRRAQVLDQIGLDTARKSAVTGDAGAASTDFQTSRLDSPAGQLMKTTLANEKAAIANYADRIAQETGGSPMNDQSAKYARGGAIMAPLESMSDWFDAKTKALYDTAAERAQGVPTELDNFRKVLGDDSLATNSDRVQMRNAIQSYAKQLNIIRDDGSVFSDGQQAEAMRKYLNENWSPQNAGLVNKLKAALDQDVMSAAGEDVYGAARQLWAMKKNTLDNPKGIAQLLDASGPNGINRKVPVEKVADTVANMPADQLAHIVETLKNAPPEIQPQAQAALAEIKAQYAHNVYDIGTKHQGQWNAKGVRKYLDSNSKRMQIVFEPEELQKFGVLNDAGNILAKDQSYPGAAAQHANLVRAGVSHGIQTGATTIGGAIAGTPGAVVGGIVGNKLADKFNDASTLRATQRRMVKLSDLLDAGKESTKKESP